MNKHLKRDSHHISEHAWWYEEPHGITVVQESSQHTEQVKISWKALAAALKRKQQED